MLPITTKPGYHHQLKSLKGNTWYSRIVWYDSMGTRYSQVKPFDRPLPYIRQGALEIEGKRWGNGPEIPDADWRLPKGADKSVRLAYERAFNKLRTAINRQGNGELGITLAQSHLTYRLYKDYLKRFVYMQAIADICSTLDRFSVFVRKAGNATERRGRAKWRLKAARVLGVRPTSDREVRRKLDGQFSRTAATGFSAEYLAFHYGWSPLFKEIHQNLKFLSEGIDYPKGWYQESGSCYMNVVENDVPKRKFQYRVVVKLGCMAEVQEELSYTLNILGLANPAAIAWDAVKWSFVLDWALTLGQTFQNATAFLGIKFSNSYKTTYQTSRCLSSFTGAGGGYSQTVEGYDVRRDTTWRQEIPDLRVKNPIGSDVRKALAQISLLAMFGLKPNHRK